MSSNLSQAQQKKSLPVSRPRPWFGLSLAFLGLSQPRNPAGSPDEMGQDGWCCSRRYRWSLDSDQVLAVDFTMRNMSTVYVNVYV